jgi:DNA-binding transcriptional ArsR family regulator
VPIERLMGSTIDALKAEGYAWTSLSLLANMLTMQSRQRPPNAVFRALADETRRQILDYLRAGPRTSGEIADQFHSSWPTISRHLSVLRTGGLVVTERKGQAIYYELNTSVFQDLIQHLVACMKPARRPASARRRMQEA